MKKLSGFVIMLCVLFLSSCAQRPEEMVGPTIGSMDIIADESLKSIVAQEEEIFERHYPYAHLNLTYLNEYDMVQKFLGDSIDVIITTRALKAEEIEFFKQKSANPRHILFATGAIAFITNRNSKDTAYIYEDLVSLLQEPESGIRFVIENVKSGITQEILQLINKPGLPAHFYALPSKEEVLEYVLEHENAIGIIDYSDISDSDTPFTRVVLESIHLLGITRPVDSIQHGFVKPFQYNLQERKYPFTRDLYLITKTGKTDVATGFASFICGEIGQKIILKAGLLPIYQTERVIEFNHISDIKVVK